MIGGIPKRPTGSSPEALFMQWMYDNIVSILRGQEVNGVAVPINHTTRGRYAVPNAVKTLPTRELKVCEDDGSEATWIFYAYKKPLPHEATADSGTITADVTTVTADS